MNHPDFFLGGCYEDFMKSTFCLDDYIITPSPKANLKSMRKK